MTNEPINPVNGVPCPRCEGKGSMFAFVNTGDDFTKHRSGIFNCDQCKGAGSVTKEHYERYLAGKIRRDARLAAGISLRQEAERLGISVVELSAIECGKMPNVLGR